MDTFNFVDVVENNPISKLTGEYQGYFIELVNENFNEEEKRLFVTSLYTYLNYDPNNDFVIDLMDVWKWCGFSRIDPAKRLLVKFFKEEVNYKVLIPPRSGIKEGRGGDRKSENILMTVNTFKRFCLMARTDKGNEIHGYFIKMEEIVMTVMCKQNKDLSMKLLKNTENTEKVILANSHKTPLVYIGIVEENIIKFGQSKNIKERVKTHKREFPSFVLKYTVHSKNYIALEDEIKNVCQMENSLLYGRRITKEYDGKNQTELIQLDSSFTIDNFYEEVQRLDEILTNRRTLGDNYTIMQLRAELKTAKDKIKMLEDYCEEHGIEYENITSKRPKKDYEEMSQDYIYKFLKDLYNKNVGETIVIENAELFKLYEEFVSKEYDSMYVLGEQKLMLDISKCHNIKPTRVTLPKDHPEYVKGKDNRKKGYKKITFNDYFKNWINERC